MPLYEHVFLARQDISVQQVEALIESFRSILTERGGTLGKTEYWGLKGLTYRIKKNRKAHFALMDIDAPPEAVSELERQMSLATDIIRYLTVKVDEHEQGPSAMMRRSDRDERGDRGDRGGRGDRGDRFDRGDRGGPGPRRDRDFGGGREAAAPRPEIEAVVATEEEPE